MDYETGNYTPNEDGETWPIETIQEPINKIE